MTEAINQTRAVWPPEPGTFSLRLAPKAWPVAAMIDRSEDGQFRAIINGQEQPPDPDPAIATGVARIWSYGRRIDLAEYRWRLAMMAWAIWNDPEHPAANPTRPINPNDLKPIRRHHGHDQRANPPIRASFDGCAA